MARLDKAILIASHAHLGQMDQYGNPYILHPLRMMMRMKSPVEKIVAVLHDVVEKSSFQLADLSNEGFSDEIVDAVDFLSKQLDEKYTDYIARVKLNDLAIRVKIVDIEDKIEMLKNSNYKNFDSEKLKRYEQTLSSLGKL